MNKTAGVMTALKGRKGFGSKKGVALLGIMAKLSAKRKAVNDKKEKNRNGRLWKINQQPRD